MKRGLYQSAAEASGTVSLRGTCPEASDGSLINADLNGAANILRKANVNMKLSLTPIGKSFQVAMQVKVTPLQLQIVPENCIIQNDAVLNFNKF